MYSVTLDFSMFFPSLPTIFFFILFLFPKNFNLVFLYKQELFDAVKKLGYDTDKMCVKCNLLGRCFMRNDQIPKALREYRKLNHYSVKDVSLMLQEYDFDVAQKTIYGWEVGQSQPSADILLTLCEIYNIPNILSAFGYKSSEELQLSSQERALIKSYRAHPELQEAVNILLSAKPMKTTEND